MKIVEPPPTSGGSERRATASPCLGCPSRGRLAPGAGSLAAVVPGVAAVVRPVSPELPDEPPSLPAVRPPPRLPLSPLGMRFAPRGVLGVDWPPDRPPSELPPLDPPPLPLPPEPPDGWVLPPLRGTAFCCASAEAGRASAPATMTAVRALLQAEYVRFIKTTPAPATSNPPASSSGRFRRDFPLFSRQMAVPVIVREQPASRFLDTRIAGPIQSENSMIHSTTILAVRHKDRAVLAGDGQVTFGQTVVKQRARKIRRLYNDRILAGFAGSAADSFALFGRFESKLEQYRGNLERSAVELAKDWRSDRILRRLEAMLVVLDKANTFLLSGNGDLIEPDDGVVGIGSGGPFAVAAAKALVGNTDLDARTIAERAMAIAGEICIYTNAQIVIEEL